MPKPSDHSLKKFSYKGVTLSLLAFTAACSPNHLPNPSEIPGQTSLAPPLENWLQRQDELAWGDDVPPPRHSADDLEMPPVFAATPFSDGRTIPESIPVGPNEAPPPRLFGTYGLAKIHLKPDLEAPIIGAFRAGQSVRVTPDELDPYGATRRRPYRCTGRWFSIAPRGYVCEGGAGHPTADPNHPAVLAGAAVLPRAGGDYPFRVGVSVGAPRYLRIPTSAEQRATEKRLDAHLASPPAPDDKRGGAIDPTSAGHGPHDELLRYFEYAKPPLLDSQNAYMGMKISWSRQFDANGRTWLLQPDLTLIPKDKVRIKETPRLRGIDLRQNPDMALPLAFTWLTESPVFRRNAAGKLSATNEVIPRHAFLPATTDMARGPGGYYWKLRDGRFIRYHDVTIIKAAKKRPRTIRAGAKWVDVRVTWGFIVAYEGDVPVFATAMSPGMDGVSQRKHATKRGSYSIGWKMLSADMSGRENGMNWFVDEVPWVQYYKDSYALHGAWWHNDFGRPKSHGCINLSPPDARTLFAWMDPQIPKGWYAATAYYPHVPGTSVFLHP